MPLTEVAPFEFLAPKPVLEVDGDSSLVFSTEPQVYQVLCKCEQSDAHAGCVESLLLRHLPAQLLLSLSLAIWQRSANGCFGGARA